MDIDFTPHTTDIGGVPMYDAKGLSEELSIALATARNMLITIGSQRIGRKKFISREALKKYLANNK